jgi:hypothetical protein
MIHVTPTAGECDRTSPLCRDGQRNACRNCRKFRIFLLAESAAGHVVVIRNRSVTAKDQLCRGERKTLDTVSSLTWLAFCPFNQRLISAVITFNEAKGGPFGHSARMARSAASR